MRGLLVLLVACGPPATPKDPTGKPDPLLAPLPKPGAVDTVNFTSVIVCDRCHTPGETQMRGSQGQDISPVGEIRTGMMFLAARDPYYLAALRREIAANPGAKPAIEKTCLRCHAPVGFAEAGGSLTLDDVVSGAGDIADLARDGVGCLGCHGLDPAGLGDETTFTGFHSFVSGRIAFGRLAKPDEEAMIQMSKTTPKPSAHVSQSRLCASCHTVLVRALDRDGKPTGDEIPEQTTFLEWRDSAYVDGGERAKTCQGCHMPLSEDELGTGPEIATPLSTRPPTSTTRSPYRRHALRGGNSYLLRRLADHAGWLNAQSKPEQLRAAADATDVFLGSAAEILIERTKAPMKVTISNRTGHKLPTGYPTRRMWLHVIAKDAAGAVVFESGRHKDGALVDNRGRRLDEPGVILPHRTSLTAPNQVIVWEAVPVDAQGKRTHLLLGTAKVVKDNRLLPIGWKPDHPDAARTKPIGVTDPDFVAGQDSIEIDLPADATTVTLELLYQPIPPETIDSYKPTDSREAARFLDIVKVPPQPVALATKQITL